MSVVNAKTAVSKPGTVRIRTGGTSSTVSIATSRARSGASRARTSEPGADRAEAAARPRPAGEITFGATPPEMRPIE